MNLISKKRVLKKYLFLMNLLCFGASYLACVSCQGMDEKKLIPDSNKQCMPYSNERETKKWVNNAEDSTHAGEEENYPVNGKKSIKSSGSLYHLSPSEMFSFKIIIQESNNPKKISRRIEDKKIDEFNKLRMNNYSVEEALLEVKK